jgi:hypothetical protein
MILQSFVACNNRLAVWLLCQQFDCYGHIASSYPRRISRRRFEKIEVGAVSFSIAMKVFLMAVRGKVYVIGQYFE